MERLLVDMDGVLANVYAQFIKYEYKESGITKQLSEISGMPEDVAFKRLYKYVNTKGFFLDAPPIEDGVEVLEKLNNQYDLFIVSSATEFPLSLTGKMLWLEKHFSFITWRQVVLCGTKEIVSGDIMIDDHFKNLDAFKGKTILFTQPHNIERDEKNHVRVSGWRDIEKMLLK